MARRRMASTWSRAGAVPATKGSLVRNPRRVVPRAENAARWGCARTWVLSSPAATAAPSVPPPKPWPRSWAGLSIQVSSYDRLFSSFKPPSRRSRPGCSRSSTARLHAVDGHTFGLSLDGDTCASWNTIRCSPAATRPGPRPASTRASNPHTRPHPAGRTWPVAARTDRWSTQKVRTRSLHRIQAHPESPGESSHPDTRAPGTHRGWRGRAAWRLIWRVARLSGCTD